MGAAALLLSAGIAACGDDGGGTEEEPPPPPPTTTVQFNVVDPCTTAVPEPNDLFIGTDGVSERTACPKPADPIDAAVFTAQLEEGAPLDAVVRIPVSGTLDATSLSSTVTFSFTSTTGMDVPQEGLPPLVYLAQVGAATTAEGWEIIRSAPTFSGGAIQLQPPAELLRPNTRHVVIATRGLRDLEMPQGKLAQSPVVGALVGTSPVVADAIEGVDGPGAARLERQRQALQPILQLLATRTNPPIPRADIVSIHSFETQPGFERMGDEVERYYEAIESGRYSYDVQLSEVTLSSIFIGIPVSQYPNVARYYRGVIKAPRFLDEDGRWRKDWVENPQTVDIHVTISAPSGASSGGVVLHIPAYGRGAVDGRSIAQGMSATPRAYVMTVDMRCHGFRGPDLGGRCVENRSTADIDNLVDAMPNNGNPDIQGFDGIPDDSGVGFFPGDPVALRDSQMAAVLEIVHLLSSLRDPTNYQPEVNPVVSRIHVIAQGYMAPLAVMAQTLVRDLPQRNSTLQLPSGGAGLAELILNAAADQRGAFINGLPDGVGQADVPELLDRLRDMFAPLDLARYRDEIQARFRTGPRFERVLLPHGSVEEFITEDARNALTGAIGIPSERVSEHLPTCDDFYLYSCQAGQEVLQQQTAVQQMVLFVDTRGVTVVRPATQ